MTRLTCQIVALTAIGFSAAATGQDLYGITNAYSAGFGESFNIARDWEGACGVSNSGACFAAPPIFNLYHTSAVQELPILASTDLAFDRADSSAGPSAAVAVGSNNDQSDLAKQVNNPIASLISVPVENNWDIGIGAAHATRYLANIEPVIPFSLNEDWNLITRTVVQVIDRQALVNNPNAPASLRRNQSGIGDILQSFFFSPKKELDGWIIGAGPVGYYPTASDSALGLGKWGAGPTFVVLRQEHGFTYGLLANQVWSVGGQQGRPNFSSLYLQPFLLYTAKSYTSISVDLESSYDWYENQWIVPINLQLKQLLKIGKQPVQFAAGYRYYIDRPTGDANWGLRFTVTLIFPKKPS